MEAVDEAFEKAVDEVVEQVVEEDVEGVVEEAFEEAVEQHGEEGGVVYLDFNINVLSLHEGVSVHQSVHWCPVIKMHIFSMVIITIYCKDKGRLSTETVKCLTLYLSQKEVFLPVENILPPKSEVKALLDVLTFSQ